MLWWAASRVPLLQRDQSCGHERTTWGEVHVSMTVLDVSVLFTHSISEDSLLFIILVELHSVQELVSKL